MRAALAVTVFAVAYLFIATERINRVVVALAGAAAMVLIGATDGHAAFFSEETGVDWNVIFLLLGMMIIVSVIKQTGLSEYLAIWSAKKARGQPFRIMVMLVLLTAVASAVLDNVTTVLLVAPVTFLVCERLAVPAAPYLIAEVLASNIGGAATLVGDPPNIIIASRAGLSFNDFLLNMGPIVCGLLVVFVLLCRVMFRNSFRYDEDRVAEVMALDEKEVLGDRRHLARCLAVLGAVVAAFVLHPVFHLEPSVIALLGAGTIVIVSGAAPAEFLEEVEWPTLVFFMGLFIMVGGLVETGVIRELGESVSAAVDGRYLLAATGLLFGSAVLSGLVDNIPYVASMTPLVQSLVDGAADPDQGRALWWALALGADLGGNATAIGASANVVVLGIAARNGQPISFWQFTRYGLIVAAITVLLSWPYLWLRYYL